MLQGRLGSDGHHNRSNVTRSLWFVGRAVVTAGFQKFGEFVHCSGGVDGDHGADFGIFHREDFVGEKESSGGDKGLELLSS